MIQALTEVLLYLGATIALADLALSDSNVE